MGVQLFFIPVVHSRSALSGALQRLKEDLSSARWCPHRLQAVRNRACSLPGASSPFPRAVGILGDQLGLLGFLLPPPDQHVSVHSFQILHWPSCLRCSLGRTPQRHAPLPCSCLFAHQENTGSAQAAEKKSWKKKNKHIFIIKLPLAIYLFPSDVLLGLSWHGLSSGTAVSWPLCRRGGERCAAGGSATTTTTTFCVLQRTGGHKARQR